MARTVSIDSDILNRILERLDELTRDVKALKGKLLEEPLYGSDEWWVKEIKEAEEGFKKGDFVSFDKTEDAIKWLES